MLIQEKSRKEEEEKNKRKAAVEAEIRAAKYVYPLSTGEFLFTSTRKCYRDRFYMGPMRSILRYNGAARRGPEWSTGNENASRLDSAVTP